MSHVYYILDEQHRVQSARDVIEWGKWYENSNNRRVARTQFECGVMVSTVFIGIDHRWLRFDGPGPPLVFETMTYEATEAGGWDDERRYSSWDDAEMGHKAVVRRVKALLEKAGLSTVEITD